MSPLINMAGVWTACQKPECATGSGTLHRHHKGCQAMFMRHFEARRGHSRYDAFVARYHQFLPEDCATICDSHHAEIHQLYLPIIERHWRVLNRPICRWTWRQAERLMDDLTAECNAWLTYPSPGARWTR